MNLRTSPVQILHSRRVLFLALLCAGLALMLQPQAATWRGTVSSDWADPNNWDPKEVPSGDVPIVIPFGTPAVPDGFLFSDLTLKGGTLTGNFNIAGNFQWSGGTLKDGTTTILPGARLHLSGATGKPLDGHLLINRGTVDWIGHGLMNAINSAEFRNEESGKIEITVQSTSGFRDGAGDPSRFINLGEIQKGGANVTFDIRSHFEQRGSIHVAAGQVKMHSGGTLLSKMTAEPGAEIALMSGAFSLEGPLEVQNLVFSGGNFGGTHTLKGSAVWRGGTFKRAETTLAADSILTLAETGAKTMDAATLNNAGTIHWIGRGLMNANNASAINNQAGGRIEIETQNISQIRNTSGQSSTLQNHGLLVKTGSRDLFHIRLRFNNTGTVEATSGDLRMEEGGRISGNFTAASGAFVRLWSGEFELEGEINSDGFEFAGGTFTGEHRLKGSALWTGGTFLGGKTEIAKDATLQGDDTGPKILDDHVLENSGRITWSSPGVLILNNGSIVRNLPEASFQIEAANNHVFRSDRGATGLFANQGSVRKSGGASNSDMRIDFQNSGSIRVSAGNLRFQSGFNQTEGEFLLENATAGATTGLKLEGGILRGTGTIEGTVINNAIVSPGIHAGLLTITGDYTQNSSGTLLLEIAGLNPVTEHDRLEIQGKALLDGTIVAAFTSGFEPVVGNRFEVLTYRSRTGEPVLDDVSQALTPEFDATTLTLITEREPIILEPFSLNIAPAGPGQFSVVLQGQAEQPYTIEASTDLVNWTEVFSTEAAEAETIEFLDTPPANIIHRAYRASTAATVPNQQ